MSFAIDFEAMAGVASRLTRDRAAVADTQHIATPWTGISAVGADPGQAWLGGVVDEVDQAVDWLSRRNRAIHQVIDDVRAVDGAEGERYVRLRRRLHDRIDGSLTRERLDDLLADRSQLHTSEAAF